MNVHRGFAIWAGHFVFVAGPDNCCGLSTDAAGCDSESVFHSTVSSSSALKLLASIVVTIRIKVKAEFITTLFLSI